jgi:hypothetical protein
MKRRILKLVGAIAFIVTLIVNMNLGIKRVKKALVYLRL